MVSNKLVVTLENNMMDENGLEVFQAGIPYEVEDGHITNEDGLRVALKGIWVNFSLEPKLV